MFFDEFVFHHRRKLGKWESLGHPIDTIFFLLPFIYSIFYSDLVVFIVLSVLSSLIITKDEFVHSKECDAKENWLHSILFIIHPVSLFVLWLANINGYQNLIIVQTAVISLFLFYQIFYWNFYAKSY